MLTRNGKNWKGATRRNDRLPTYEMAQNQAGRVSHMGTLDFPTRSTRKSHPRESTPSRHRASLILFLSPHSPAVPSTATTDDSFTLPQTHSLITIPSFLYLSLTTLPPYSAEVRSGLSVQGLFLCLFAGDLEEGAFLDLAGGF
jgi:hypothetical protein